MSVPTPYLEELDDVAGAEHAVRRGELGGLGRREVGSQHAAVGAAAAKDLARRARAHDNHRRHVAHHLDCGRRRRR